MLAGFTIILDYMKSMSHVLTMAESLNTVFVMAIL